MTIAVVVLLVLLAVAGFALWRVAAAFLAHLQQDNRVKTERVGMLEEMLDHVRADRANVPLPSVRREMALEVAELPDVLQGNLDAIEDDEARAEYEAVIRARLTEDPKLDPVRLAADLFGR